jgi:KDO2-lipid IV(A) lauroyltransferase
MAKKERSPARDYLVFLIVRLVVCFLQMLPLRVGARLASILSKLAYIVNKRHREVARENLRQAFPERCADPDECDKLVRSCYKHFCLMLIEMMYLPRKIHINNWRNYIQRISPDLAKGLISGRPLLIVTGHLGNWELAGFGLGLLGFRTYAIARILDNPYLERFFKRFRQKTGQTILAKKGDFDNITAVLVNNGIIATLGDQDAGQRGLFVNFLHRPASTHKAIALLALQHRALMVVTGTMRVGNTLQYEVICEDVIDADDFAHQPDAVRTITERYTCALERLIRRFPDQYFWLHRRWKHQPAVKKAKQAA